MLGNRNRRPRRCHVKTAHEHSEERSSCHRNANPADRLSVHNKRPATATPSLTRIRCALPVSSHILGLAKRWGSMLTVMALIRWCSREKTLRSHHSPPSDPPCAGACWSRNTAHTGSPRRYPCPHNGTAFGLISSPSPGSPSAVVGHLERLECQVCSAIIAAPVTTQDNDGNDAKSFGKSVYVQTRVHR